ncbi:hypothetical protein ACQUW5_04675 [Legionella sp. CNM-1927-20]|uniref:hypothetical protein n=1 Tax=Legionella sp. CNM-1927-20 TaxID=3422221 RepID=UPI00403ADD66
MFFIKLSYSYLAQNLFVFCSHGDSNLAHVKLFFKRNKLPLNEFENKEIKNYSTYINSNQIDVLHEKIKDLLVTRFEAIKQERENYQKITCVIFMADVNLGQPGLTIYPEFLLDDFIQQQFTPSQVEKILFSSSLEVVDDANEKQIEKNIKIIDPSFLLKEVKPKIVAYLNGQNTSIQNEEPPKNKLTLSNVEPRVDKRSREPSEEFSVQLKEAPKSSLPSSKPGLFADKAKDQEDTTSEQESSSIHIAKKHYKGI